MSRLAALGIRQAQPVSNYIGGQQARQQSNLQQLKMDQLPKQYDQQNRLAELQIGGLESAQQDRQRLRELTPEAMSGDESAMNEMAALDPKFWASLSKEQREAAAQKVTQSSRLLAAVQSADPAQRDAVWQQVRPQLIELGADPAGVPERPDPAWLASNVAKGREVEKILGGAGGGNSIGTYNPRDYTVASFAKFQKTGDPAILERYESQRTVDIGGVPHTFDPARGGYYPADVSGGGAPTPITAGTVAQSAATIEGAKEGAKVAARADAEANSPEALKDRAQAVRQTEDTLAVVNQLLASDLGSITGVMSQTPTIRPGSMDLVRLAERLEALLTTDNLGLMTGVLTDRDIQLIKNIGSGLKVSEGGIQMSEEGARERLSQIRDKLVEKLGGSSQPAQQSQSTQQPTGPATEQQNGSYTGSISRPQPPAGSGASIDDLVNQYAD